MKTRIATFLKPFIPIVSALGLASIFQPLVTLLSGEAPATSLYIWNLIANHLPAGAPSNLSVAMDECVGGTRPMLVMLLVTALAAIFGPLADRIYRKNPIGRQVQLAGTMLSTVLLVLVGSFYAYAFKGRVAALGWTAEAALGAGYCAALAFFAVGMVLTLTVFLLELPTEDPANPAYRVGTLKYSTLQLLTVCAWMIWGDFCFNLMETVFPNLMPLQLRNAGASPMAMSALMRTIPAFLAFFMCPIISYKSDRCRSRFGRRKPYMILTAPFLVVFLGSLGYVEEIAAYLNTHGEVLSRYQLNSMTATLLLVAFLVIGFQFFNEFVGSVYYYLYNDVLPREVMGRFQGVSSIKGAIAGIIWGTFVFPQVGPYTKHIYWGMALLYLFGFSLMMWRVREGDYPPVEDVVKVQDTAPRASRVAGWVQWARGCRVGIQNFFKECFSHPIYLSIFTMNAVTFIADAGSNFNILFITEQIGLTYKDQGRIGIWCAMLSLVLSMPFGGLVDKLTPVRAFVICSLLQIPACIARALVWDYNSQLAISLIASLPMMLQGLAWQPMMMQLLPRDKYGQFSSANSMVRQIGNIIAPLLAAAFVMWLATPIVMVKPGEALRVYNEGKNWKYTQLTDDELRSARDAEAWVGKPVAVVDMTDDLNMTEKTGTLQQLNPKGSTRIVTLPGSQAPRNHVIANVGNTKPLIIKEANWRSFYIWKIAWLVINFLTILVVYRYFIKLGGQQGYVPPGTEPVVPVKELEPVAA